MWKQGGALLRKKASVLVPPPHEGDGKPKGTASSSSSSLDKYGSSDNKEDDGIPAYVKSKAHHAGQGYYVNPWPSAQASSWVPTFQIPIAWSEEAHPSIKRIQSVKPDFDREAAPHEIKATWLGHAGVLVQLPPLQAGTAGITLLVDAIFSARASPSQWAGPTRRLPNPCEVEDLPHIDFVLTSHNHYDHLDLATIEKLIARGGDRTRYVIPLGIKQWLIDLKVHNDQIIEQDWWEEVTLQPSEIGGRPEAMDELGSLRISCVPAQHNSARTGWDKGASLWAGFVIEQFACKPSEAPSRTCIYAAGDTGYKAEEDGPVCPAFEQIGERYGPMDLSLIPIWRGGTLSFVSYLGLRIHPEALTRATHASPQDAVSMHADVRSKATLAIHFGTFGAEDESLYAISLLTEACADVGVSTILAEENSFGVSNIGETFLVPVRS